MEVEMEIESQQPASHPLEAMTKPLRRALQVLNFAIMVIGSTASPLLLRLYFLHGGRRKWFSSLLQTAGWPLILLPLSLSYYFRRRHSTESPVRLYFITPSIFIACLVLGLLTGLDNLLYAYGVSYLPVSTSSILVSTQLGFTALAAFVIVGQRFTAYSVNAVALLSFGAVVLALHSSGDRPRGESGGQYYMGFFMTLGAAVLYGMLLPVVELIYARTKQAVTYTLVMEMQLVMGFFATAFSTVGMVINEDFQAIPREAKEFGLGEFKYYMLLVWSAILWQFFFLGTVGAIFYASALLSGIINAVLIPVTEVLAVIFFQEKFTGGKGVALGLSLWGFASYFYGEFKEKKKRKASTHDCRTLIA